MSFEEWLKHGWIKPHQTSAAEISEILKVVARDLRTSAAKGIDPDWKFAIAYNAALQSASAALKASGYDVPKGGGAHYRTIESLKLTIIDDGSTTAPLQRARAKRGDAIYESAGIASDLEVEEMQQLAMELRDRVIGWLRAQHPELIKR
jgi:hypothetical protein